MMVHARINAGYIDSSHWIQGQGGGGRIIGEFCHFLDWARFIVGKPMIAVWASALPDGTRYNRDNIVATITFADGSLANLMYLANGDGSVSKEFYEVFCGGAVARLNDFESLELAHNRKKQSLKSSRDKGHKIEIEKTVSAMQKGLPSPISFPELVEVTEATFAIHESLSTGLPIRLKSNDLLPSAEADEVPALATVRA